MLYTIAVILLILWALGLVTGTTIGGFIHLLLVIAVVMILLRLIFLAGERCNKRERLPRHQQKFIIELL
jgi:hypothetical protein